jgi:hypothetical protein
MVSYRAGKCNGTVSRLLAKVIEAQQRAEDYIQAAIAEGSSGFYNGQAVEEQTSIEVCTQPAKNT